MSVANPGSRSKVVVASSSKGYGNFDHVRVLCNVFLKQNMRKSLNKLNHFESRL